MSARLRSLVAAQVAVVVLAFAVPLVAATRAADLPPPIQVNVGSSGPTLVDRGTTLRRLLEAMDLKPTSGNLLDVEGKIITRRAFKGRVLLNGRPVPHRTVLTDGDRVELLNRHDRTEALAREIVKLPGRHPEDPQFYLGTVPGENIITTGKVSGKLVSSVFRPTGPIRQPRSVALTFDDGPNPVDTPRILRILHRFHVHATFFTIGYLVVRYPQLVKKERRMGMVIGNHSWDHPTTPPLRDRKPGVIRSEMARPQDALAALRVKTKLFRPPGGSSSPEVVEIAKELHMRVVLWSVDPQDWRNGIRARAIARNVLSHVRPGSIILLHDGGGDQSATVRALPFIIRGIRHKHLTIKPVR